MSRSNQTRTRGTHRQDVSFITLAHKDSPNRRNHAPLETFSPLPLTSKGLSCLNTGMNSNENNINPQADLINTSQPWIGAAIAQQEEHLRRIQSCTGGDYPNATVGMAHSWEAFSLRPGVTIQQCWRCKVTKTDEDYQRKTGAL